MQKMGKMEGRLGEELTHQMIKAEMGIQRTAKREEDNMARNQQQHERNELRQEERVNCNMNHNQVCAYVPVRMHV